MDEKIGAGGAGRGARVGKADYFSKFFVFGLSGGTLLDSHSAFRAVDKYITAGVGFAPSSPFFLSFAPSSPVAFFSFPFFLFSFKFSFNMKSVFGRLVVVVASSRFPGAFLPCVVQAGDFSDLCLGIKGGLLWS